MTKQSGFTLIELMIVLLVAGLTIGIVGPVGQKQYDKVMVVKDREMLMRSLAHARFKSFAQRTPSVIELTGRQLIYRQAGFNQVLSFRYLSFPEQMVTINSHGFWQSQVIHWYELDQKKTFELLPSYEVSQRVITVP